MECPSGPRFGRPSDRFGPPAVLFSPELAPLKRDLDHLNELPVDREIGGYAVNFTSTAASFFREESSREMALWPILGGLLAGECKWQPTIAGGSVRPDAVLLEDDFPYLIIEIKNEVGLGGDPFLQGLLLYSKFIAYEKVPPPSRSSPYRFTNVP